jgi:hypothetical protein
VEIHVKARRRKRICASLRRVKFLKWSCEFLAAQRWLALFVTQSSSLIYSSHTIVTSRQNKHYALLSTLPKICARSLMLSFFCTHPPALHCKSSFYSVDYTPESVPRKRRTASYMPNMMAALGTTLSICGTRPPYRAAIPSSFQTSLKHWAKPVYLSWGTPSTDVVTGACLSRVRTTS